ncbi:MAG TPA: serine/threonine-protein kinase [Kofleriaceae bacterium]
MTEVQAGRGPARDSVLLGKYRVESTLGFGGMGLVIKAHNIALDEHVAIKLLREDVQVDGDNITRFVREAKNAVKLKSEHVARIRDVGTFEDGRPYMVMELLEGLDLGKLLLDHGAIDRERAVDLVLQTCDAIAEAHSLGIVHRDIKPTNLFVTKRRDGTDLLKVLDFGISKAQMSSDLSLTQTQSMLGTPAYMSPEQMRSARTVDPRSDIWSLGCVLYELVEGKQPFEASNFAELCVMVTIESFAPLTTAPELTPIIEQALAKNLEDRFQDMADLAYALEPFASDPERAYRQVARVFRVLGRTHPDTRDSTPMPGSRPSTPSPFARSASSPAIAPAAATRPSVRRDTTPGAARDSRISQPVLPQTPIPDLRDRKGPWRLLALLVALFAIGLGGSLFFMNTDELNPTAADDSVEANDPGAAAAPIEMTVTRDDAAVEVAVDAGATGSGAVVQTTGNDVAKPKPITTKPKPPRKPPRKIVKQPPRTPTTTATPPTPPKPPPAPPKPKCDPFDNPKGCK